MIISKIIGGLGNQLFQYAAGKALALHHNTPLLLDVSGFDQYKLRNFDLAAFHTDIRFADRSLVKQFTNRAFAGKVRDRILPVRLRNVLKERYIHFNPQFFKVSSNVYLQGYWQSEKYFAPIKELLRQEFTLKPEYIQQVQMLAQEIQNRESIAVHIRMGDYMESHIKEFHGVLPVEYYRHSIALLLEKYPGAVCYFFSDNIEWVRKKMDVANAVFVSGIHSKTHFEDFYLMSQCKHNIIANSSFSWWAAWLNSNKTKTVIAPKQWYGVKGPTDTHDLFPEGWVRI